VVLLLEELGVGAVVPTAAGSPAAAAGSAEPPPGAVVVRLQLLLVLLELLKKMVLGLVVRNVARVGQQRAVQHVRARGHARLPLLAAARERGTAAAERTTAGLVRGVQAGACRPGGVAPGPPVGCGCCWCCWNHCAKPAGRLGKAPTAPAKAPRPLAETTHAACAATPSPPACSNTALRRVGCRRGGRHRGCVCGVVLVQLHVVEHVGVRFTSIRIARALPAANAAVAVEKLDPARFGAHEKQALVIFFSCWRWSSAQDAHSASSSRVSTARTLMLPVPPRYCRHANKLQPLFETRCQVSNMSL